MGLFRRKKVEPISDQDHFLQKVPDPGRKRGVVRDVLRNIVRRHRRLPFEDVPSTNGSRIKKVIWGESLGHGVEGTVYRATLVVERNGKERKVAVAAKVFRPAGISIFYKRAKFNPFKQFQIIKELIKQNHAKKWDLHLPKTVRLEFDHKSGWILYTSLINEPPLLKLTNPTPQQQMRIEEYMREKNYERDFVEDEKRQVRILEANGYNVNPLDTFAIHEDPKTGRLSAVIVDFGTIEKV